MPCDLLERVLPVEHGATLLVPTPPRLGCVRAVFLGGYVDMDMDMGMDMGMGGG